MNTYHIHKNESVSRLFLDLKDDFSEKTIFVEPGEYDIYREYRELALPAPPDDIDAGDYLDRCVFLPPNTRLIGLGQVLFKWSPDKNEITRGEARTWSPLNVRYGCYVENISIFCRYGRYCIHDDSHNDELDRGTLHRYKNIRCIYEFSEDEKGFNNTTGFGFSQKSTIIFEDSELAFEKSPESSPHHSAFYGHSASGFDLLPEESPTIILKNSIIRSENNCPRTIRLQSLNRVLLRTRTVIENCHIDGGVYFTLYKGEGKHAFELTLLKSGHPPLLFDKPEEYPYKVRIFD